MLRYEPKKVSNIINACCALHNICIFYNVNQPEIIETFETTNHNNVEYESQINASRLRQVGQCICHDLMLNFERTSN